MYRNIDEYLHNGKKYGFEVEYRVLEGETEPGDGNYPAFHEPDQLVDLYISNVEVYDEEGDEWYPVTDTELVLEIENSITLDDLQ